RAARPMRLYRRCLHRASRLPEEAAGEAGGDALANRPSSRHPGERACEEIPPPCAQRMGEGGGHLRALRVSVVTLHPDRPAACVARCSPLPTLPHAARGGGIISHALFAGMTVLFLERRLRPQA